MLNDMTEGSPIKILRRFAIPMLLSMMFQQFYSIADSVVAGNFIGKNGLAAVGASYPITVLFIAIATGANTGCSVIVSQIFGEKNYTKLKTAISTAIISIFVLAIFITILGILICNPIMAAIHTPASIFTDSSLYLRIYVFGLLFLFLYNAATAIFTALGDSKTPLYFLIFSSILNIILDLVFVIIFHMGVSGVAWATFIAQGISSFLAVGDLYLRIKKIKVAQDIPLFDWTILKPMTTIAIPSIMQHSFVSVGQVFIQGLINGFGADIVAGYSAAFKINTFVVMSMMTMANALSSFTAQNAGAKQFTRIKEGYRTTFSMSSIICFVIVILELVFSQQILGIFIKTAGNEETIRAGVLFLRVVAPFHLVVTIKLVTDAVLRGTGMIYQFTTATFSDLILRVALSFLLAPSMGFLGICLSYPIGWALGACISVFFYFRGGWQKQVECHQTI